MKKNIELRKYSLDLEKELDNIMNIEKKDYITIEKDNGREHKKNKTKLQDSKF